jgi:hypothetical protein
MRSAHELQDRFDVSPSFGLFRVTLLLATARALSGLNNSPVAIGLKELAGIIIDFDL